MRIGHGYDVHRFCEGRPLILGGVEIKNEENIGLLGHSDADVAVHALMDALLGSMAFADIGVLFPDTDDRYKGISSLELLQKVVLLLREYGAELSNADITIIAEKPKLAPHITDMRKAIADAIGIDMTAIGIKATTEEGLGIAGNGIAAHAVVLVNN